jgi:hypothetical protein
MCSVGICTTEIWILLLFQLSRQEYIMQLYYRISITAVWFGTIAQIIF